MHNTTLIIALSQLRAVIVPDPLMSKRWAIEVALPTGFVADGWSTAPPNTSVWATGYRSKAAASSDAPAMVAEIATKIANAVLRPNIDPPTCRITSWSRIRMAEGSCS